MRKGFMFTAAILALATVAMLLASNALLAFSQAGQHNSLLLAKKLSYTWDDVREDLKTTLNLSVTQNQENVSIADGLPAQKDIASSLLAYALFVENYYRTADLNVSFLDADGGDFALSQLGPPLRALPYGLNYSYPDQAKQELNIDIPQENASVVRQVNITIRVPNRWFKEYPFSDVCAIWSPLKTCDGGTTNCLTFWVNVIDRNGTSYNNSASCSRFDVDKNSALTLNLHNETSQNAWMRLRVGQLPGRLIDLDLQNAFIATNTEFTFNSSAYSLNYLVALRVKDNAFNTTKTLTLTA